MRAVFDKYLIVFAALTCFAQSPPLARPSPPIAPHLVPVLEAIFQSATPEIQASGLLALLANHQFQDPKKVEDLLESVMLSAGASTHKLPLRFSGGSAEAFDAVRSTYSGLSSDQLSLYSRGTIISAKLHHHLTLQFWERALALRNNGDSRLKDCRLHLYPTYEIFYLALDQLIQQWRFLPEVGTLTRLELLAHALSTMNSFAEIQPALALLSRHRWTDGEKRELAHSLARGLNNLTPHPRAYLVHSQKTHDTFAKFATEENVLAISGEDLSQELLAAYHLAVQKQLTAGHCTGAMAGVSSRLLAPKHANQLLHLIESYNATPAFANFSLNPNLLAFGQSTSLPDPPPQIYSWPEPLGNCVGNMYRLHARSPSLIVGSQPEKQFQACVANAMEWKTPDLPADKVIHFLAKSSALTSLSRAALGNGLSGPVKPNQTPAPRQKALAEESAWPIWQSTLAETLKFLSSREAKAIKATESELWFGKVGGLFVSLRGLRDHHTSALWQLLQNEGDPDLIAIAALLGFHPDIPVRLLAP